MTEPMHPATEVIRLRARVAETESGLRDLDRMLWLQGVDASEDTRTLIARLLRG